MLFKKTDKRCQSLNHSAGIQKFLRDEHRILVFFVLARGKQASDKTQTFHPKQNILREGIRVREIQPPNPVVKWPGSDLMTLTMHSSMSYLCSMKRFEKMAKSRNPNGEAQNFNEAHLQFYSKTVPFTMYNVQCTMYNVRVPCSMQNVSVAEKVKLSTLEILATSLNNDLWSQLITGNKYTSEKFIIAQTIPNYT